MNEYYVYIYFDPRNNQPFYVGKGKDYRYLKHLKETKENTENYKKWSYIQGLRNKGLEPLIKKIQENISELNAYDIETNLIKKYGRKDIDKNGILTNICIDNRPPNTKESRQKQSESMKGEKNHRYGKVGWNKGILWSEEIKQKIRDKRKMQSPPMTGKTHTKETKILMSNKKKGIKLSEDHKRKISEGMRKKNEIK